MTSLLDPAATRIALSQSARTSLKLLRVLRSRLKDRPIRLLLLSFMQLQLLHLRLATFLRNFWFRRRQLKADDLSTAWWLDVVVVL